jgi:hypothetical protein
MLLVTEDKEYPYSKSWDRVFICMAKAGATSSQDLWGQASRFGETRCAFIKNSRGKLRSYTIQACPQMPVGYCRGARIIRQVAIKSENLLSLKCI